MYYTYNMIHKTITIKFEHQEWIMDNSINLSRYIQKKIEEEIKKNKDV